MKVPTILLMLASGFFSVSSISAVSEPLEEMRWKSRIVVLNFTSEDAGALRKLEKEIRNTKAEWKDRDVCFLHVGEIGRSGKSYAHEISHEERVAIRKRLGISSVSGSCLILVGKDGGVKCRQRSAFSLKKVYSLIDTMPMRRREMRRG